MTRIQEAMPALDDGRRLGWTTIRRIALLAASIATFSSAAAGLPPGLNEFEVELPIELRTLAGHGSVSPVTRARVTIGIPGNVDASIEPPVLLVSATADPGAHSSRGLLRLYAQAALAGGWIVIAADPVEAVSFDDDDVPLRLALDLAALATLGQQRPASGQAVLAFGGFSGGAKYAGWLAAAFASQGRTIAGVYQAGINEDTLIPAAIRFRVLDDTFRQVPVFLVSGDQDTIATPSRHRAIAAGLQRAGFGNVRIESFAGRHEVDAGSLGDALRWFRAFLPLPAR